MSPFSPLFYLPFLCVLLFCQFISLLCLFPFNLNLHLYGSVSVSFHLSFLSSHSSILLFFFTSLTLSISVSPAQAVNQAGAGPYSEQVSFRTPATNPDQVSTLALLDLLTSSESGHSPSTCLFLKWDEPNSNGAEITSYVITLDGQTITVESGTSHLITNLQPDTEYRYWQEYTENVDAVLDGEFNPCWWWSQIIGLTFWRNKNKTPQSETIMSGQTPIYWINKSLVEPCGHQLFRRLSSVQQGWVGHPLIWMSMVVSKCCGVWMCKSSSFTSSRQQEGKGQPDECEVNCGFLELFQLVFIHLCIFLLKAAALYCTSEMKKNSKEPEQQCAKELRGRCIWLIGLYQWISLWFSPFSY